MVIVMITGVMVTSRLFLDEGAPYDGKLSCTVWHGGKDGVITKSYLS